jgi:RNA polymerase sigma-70 factor (ECF subfamily)
VQEAFLELIRKEQEVVEPVAWLFSAVRYRAINLSRSEARRCKYHQELAANVQEWFVADPTGSPMEHIEVQHALADLEMRQREIVIARIWGGLSFEQIAGLMGNSTSTVHRHYQQALLELGERLMGVEHER